MLDKEVAKIKLEEILLFLFCLCVVVFPNGSMILRTVKISFVALSLCVVIAKGTIRIRINSHLKWLIAVTLLAFFSLIWAESEVHTKQGIFTIGLNFICIFLVIQLIYEIKRWKRIVYFSFIVGPIFRFFYIVGEVGFLAFSGLRNISYYGYNTIGMLSAFAIIFAYIAFYIEKIWVRKDVFAVLIMMNMVILMLSMSRKASIYLVIPIVIYWLFSGRNIFKRLKRLILLLLISLVVVWAVLNIDILYNFIGKGLLELFKHFFNIEGDQSAAGRDARIAVGLLYFEQRPWIGYGAMNFNYLFGKIENTELLVADNNFIEILVSYGIVGFTIYYAYYAHHILKIKNIIKTDNKLKLMMYGLFFAVLVCDYGVSSYIYLHVQLIFCIICITLESKTQIADMVY